jgi:inhibitor of cysteine peptidase
MESNMKKAVIILVTAIVITAVGFYVNSIMSKDATRTLKLNVNDEFIVMLDSNKTTGYEWQIDKPLDGNLIEQKSLKYTPGNTGLVGSGGKEEWRFAALKRGRSRISFKYVRPWEKNVPPSKKKIFNVEIK